MIITLYFDVKKCKIFLFALYITACLILYQGCASTGSPSGGPRDVTPPKMDSLRSAQNRQINFIPRELIFYFDEFVEVVDPIKEVLVSPPLTYIPQVKHRGKKVMFAFDEKEVLREDATYTINFGESIVDFHESNKLSNFSFVFATGSALDSMTLKGKVVDALTGEPDPEMVVFLYDNLSDSVVYKEKPFYFARPDKSGNFLFQNVKTDTFKLLAIKDENLNYRYDLPTEKIGFFDGKIILNDTSDYDISLVSSLPIPKLKIQSYDAKTYGKVNILYNTKPPVPLRYHIPDIAVQHSGEISQDSVNIWYETSLDSFSIFVYSDTIRIKPKAKQDFMKKSALRLITTNATGKVLPGDSIALNYNMPIRINPAKNIIISDTIGQLDDIELTTSEDKKSLIIRYDWASGEEYKLSFDSNTIQSIYGHRGDSLDVDIKILSPEQTADISFIFTDLDSLSDFIIKIQKEKLTVHTLKVSQSPKANLKLKGLVPDRYNVEIIQDVNHNGVWDPGDFWSKRQPEPYKFFKGESVRENKETDINISWRATKDTKNNNERQGLNPNPLNIKR